MPSKTNPGDIAVKGGRAAKSSVGREALDFNVLISPHSAISSGGGGGTPGGANTELQYNKAGAFGGSTLQFDNTLGTTGTFGLNTLPSAMARLTAEVSPGENGAVAHFNQNDNVNNPECVAVNQFSNGSTLQLVSIAPTANVVDLFMTGTGVPISIGKEATNNTVESMINLTRTTSVPPAASGIGSSLDFIIENNIGVFSTMASIQAVATDVTAGAEKSALTFHTFDPVGALLERVRINHDGNVGILTDPRSTLDINGSVTFKQVVVAPAGGPYVVLPDDHTIIVDTVSTGGPSTVQLPAISGGAEIGRRIIVKDGSGAGAAFNITINPDIVAGETIEGGPAEVITVNWGSVILEAAKVAGAPSTFLWLVLAVR